MADLEPVPLLSQDDDQDTQSSLDNKGKQTIILEDSPWIGRESRPVKNKNQIKRVVNLFYDCTDVFNLSQNGALFDGASNLTTLGSRIEITSGISVKDCDQSNQEEDIVSHVSKIKGRDENTPNGTPAEDSEYSDQNKYKTSDAVEVAGIISRTDIKSANLMEEHGQLNQDECATSNSFRLTKSRRVTEMPIHAYCEQTNQSDYVPRGASRLHRSTDIQSKKAEENCQQSDEDNSLKSGASMLIGLNRSTSTQNEMSVEDCKQYDEDGSEKSDTSMLIGSNRNKCTSSETSAEACEQFVEYDYTTSDALRNLSLCGGKDMQSRTPSASEDCKQFDHEKSIIDNGYKLTGLLEGSDSPSEIPGKVYYDSNDNIVRSTVHNFKQLGVSIKSDDDHIRYNSVMEDFSDDHCKEFSDGHKDSGIRSIVNIYSNMAYNAVPPIEKEKGRAKNKSYNFAQSEDTSNHNYAGSEAPCNLPINGEMAVNDVQINCDRVRDKENSYLEGDNVIVDSSRTERFVDSNHKTINNNMHEDEEHKAVLIDVFGNNGTKESCEDFTPTMTISYVIEMLDKTNQVKAVDKSEKLDLTVESVQENKSLDNISKTMIEEVCEASPVESTSENNSVVFGSTVDSLEETFAININENIDADDEFSSVEDNYKAITPTSPNSEDEDEDDKLNEALVIFVDENERFLNANNVEACSITEYLYVGDCENECYKMFDSKDKTVSSISDFPSDNQAMLTRHVKNNENPCIEESHKENVIEVICTTNSHGPYQECLHTIQPTTEEYTVIDDIRKLLNVEDKELIYLDAESGDFNEQSESSWEQIVSCNSGDQSSSEMQECIQIYSNDDIKSTESNSIYEEVVSESHLEDSSVMEEYIPKLRYVSSCYSENDSCSNFYSEEGDRKQSDGYVSALDVGEDLDIFKSLERLATFDRVCQSINLQDENEFDVIEETIHSNKQEDVNFTTDPPFLPRGEQDLDCNERESRVTSSASQYVITNQMECKTPNVTGKEKCEHLITNHEVKEDGKQRDREELDKISSNVELYNTNSYTQAGGDVRTKNVIPSTEDMPNIKKEGLDDNDRDEEVQEFTSHLLNAHHSSQQSGNLEKENNSILSPEDIVTLTTGKENLTNVESVDVKSESDCMKVMQETVEGTSFVDMDLTLNIWIDNCKTEEYTNNECGLVENGVNHAINYDSTQFTLEDGRLDDVGSKDLPNINPSGNNDHSYSKGIQNMPEGTTNGSNSSSKDLEETSQDRAFIQKPNEEGEVEEDNSEALTSDEDDEDTIYTCCKEFQHLWKRVNKLKRAMQKLNDQVSSEKNYLEQETFKYKKLPKSDLSLFEQKLAEVQRERWLENQPMQITHKEYWQRLREADQMCVEEIEQMNVAEEKLRHLTRITDVWMRTNVVLPYYDPPLLELESENVHSEVMQKKVNELEEEVVDLIGPSNVYMTSWLLKEADKMEAAYTGTGDLSLNLQNLNDLPVDLMILPPHLLKKIEVKRDQVKANSSGTETPQNFYLPSNTLKLQSKIPLNQDSPYNQTMAENITPTPSNTCNKVSEKQSMPPEMMLDKPECLDDTHKPDV